jgi:hypothetical protein
VHARQSSQGHRRGQSAPGGAWIRPATVGAASATAPATSKAPVGGTSGIVAGSSAGVSLAVRSGAAAPPGLAKIASASRWLRLGPALVPFVRRVRPASAPGPPRSSARGRSPTGSNSSGACSGGSRHRPRSSAGSRHMSSTKPILSSRASERITQGLMIGCGGSSAEDLALAGLVRRLAHAPSTRYPGPQLGATSKR